MLQKTKATLLATLVIALSFYLNGCKKTDHSTSSPSSETIPEWAKAKMREQKGGFTYVINEKSPAIFLDQNGNERKLTNGRLLDVPCDAEEDDFLDNSFTHLYQSVWYACGEDFKLVVEYQLSTAFAPVQTNPINPAQVSRGRFRIFDQATNTTLYSNSNVTPVTITHIGPDPEHAGKELYRVSYTVTGLSESIMNQGGTFQNRPIIYSDCPDVITTPGSWQGALPGPIVDACSKVDRISLVPAGGGGMVFVGGCDEQVSTGSSCYPSSLAAGRPHEHDIEWRKPGDANFGSWPMPLPELADITPASYAQRMAWTYPTFQGCATNPDKKERLAFFMARTYTFPVTGNLEIRYRNVKLDNFTDPCSDIDCTTSDWVYLNVNVP